jgi:hypothetical protein
VRAVVIGTSKGIKEQMPDAGVDPDRARVARWRRRVARCSRCRDAKKRVTLRELRGADGKFSRPSEKAVVFFLDRVFCH